MKIVYRKGDLLQTTCLAIAHGCNAQGVMGRGVAKVIKSKYPKAFLKYRTAHEKYGLKLGEVISVIESGKLILNCITQEYYGKLSSVYVDYPAIRLCMREVNIKVAYFYQIESTSPNTIDWMSVAFPKIGSGLGGGDWSVISDIIEEELTEVTPIVYEM